MLKTPEITALELELMLVNLSTSKNLNPKTLFIGSKYKSMSTMERSSMTHSNIAHGDIEVTQLDAGESTQKSQGGKMVTFLNMFQGA